MEPAILSHRSRPIEMLDPAAWELFGNASEPSPAEAYGGWVLCTVIPVNPEEDLGVFDSDDAMRFGPHYYNENQVAAIHQAVAERQGLPAPPVPLDS